MSRNKDFPLVEAIKRAYLEGEEDETLEPIVVFSSSGKPLGRLQDGDYVIFYDVRGEREIELTRSLTEINFNHFPIKKPLRLNFITMIEYSPALKARVVFPSDEEIRNTFVEVVTKSGLRVLKITESEKSVHLGYFFNGKRRGLFQGEEMITIPSPSGIFSYASKPEMSAREVAERVCEAIDNPCFEVVIANLANVDVVGHLENKEAVLRAVKTVDRELGRIVEECRRQKILLVVTSDHGTVEEWLYEDGSINTGHTANPVPFILADFSNTKNSGWELQEEGELADVAPTLLELLGMEKPPEMTGRSLLAKRPSELKPPRQLVLLILDGWGLREARKGNLILEAKAENFDALWSEFPHSKLKASGEEVGMPTDTVGNSEAGHLHLGAGRRILLDRLKIDRSISDGSFFQNKILLEAMEEAKRKNKSLHLLGIVSHYSSHGSINHLFALLSLAHELNLREVFIHALIGRRGEKPESGAAYVRKIEEICSKLSLGKVVTVMGRFWALDREENWDRIEKAYRALVYGEGKQVKLMS